MVFDLFKTDEDTREALSSAILVKNSHTLLSGSYGVGKTVFCGMVGIAFFDDDYVRVPLRQNMTEFDILYYIDIPLLVGKGIEKIYPRGLVTKRLKFINEVQRGNDQVYNGLLSLMAEHEIIYRDQVFKSPNYVMFLDRNPHDASSVEIPNAFLDRIDYSIDISLLHLRDTVSLMMTKLADDVPHFDLKEKVKPFLTSEQMEEVWSDVSLVKVPKSIIIWGSMISEAFKSCKMIERSTAIPRYRLDCSQCEFKGEICSALKQPIAHRFFESMVRFAQARAWLYGKKEVDYADIEFALPYTIAHRVNLKDDVAAGFPSTFEWAKQDVIRSLDIKKSIWADALKAFLSILNNKNVTEKYKTLETLSKRDLVIQQLMSWADEGLEDNLAKAKQEIEKFKKKGDLLSLEALTNELDNMPIPSHGKWELKKKIENIMEQNTIKKACTKEMDEIMPKLLQNNFITPDDYNKYIEDGHITVKTSEYVLTVTKKELTLTTFKPDVMKTAKEITQLEEK